MNKEVLVVSGVCLGVLLCVSASEARSNKADKFKHADRNRDGAVDRKERQTENKWEHKQREKTKEAMRHDIVDGYGCMHKIVAKIARQPG